MDALLSVQVRGVRAGVGEEHCTGGKAAEWPEAIYDVRRMYIRGSHPYRPTTITDGSTLNLCCSRNMSEQAQTTSSPLNGQVASAKPARAGSAGQDKATTAAATASASPPPLSFDALSETVHVYRPPSGSRSLMPQAERQAGNGVLAPLRTRSPATMPRVVLVMGWMNAPLRIVTKYAAPYALLFPTATIIVKLSQGVSFMRSRQAQLGALEKVADLVCEAEASNESRAALRRQVAQLEGSAGQAGLTMDVDVQNTLQRKAENGETVKDVSKTINEAQASKVGGMLIHSFSDGGAYNVSQLLRLLKDRDALTPLAHIMDSSPGKASPYSGSTAMTLTLANRPVIRLIVRVSIYLYLYCIYAFKALVGQKTWSRVMRDRLNSPAVWSWPNSPGREDKSASERLPPRLYLYSKSDALINYRAVEEHAQLAAKANGFDAPVQVQDLAAKNDEQPKPVVALQRWDNVPHCDIGRTDFQGYWKAVRTFLEAVL